jgi:hypothetical protein
MLERNFAAKNARVPARLAGVTTGRLMRVSLVPQLTQGEITMVSAEERGLRRWLRLDRW